MSDTQPETAFQPDVVLDAPTAPHRSRWQTFWKLFGKNRLAVSGLAIFVLFFCTALAGLVLTSGEDPLLDPARIRLQEKLRPPLSRPQVEALRPQEIPGAGIYLFGTDDLGRDVFARMLQGAWVSLTVGFVAVGISVAIGIFLGGIAGYYGPVSLRLYQVLAFVFFSASAVSAASAAWIWAAASLAAGVLLFAACGKKTPPAAKGPGGRTMRTPLFTVDTLIMRIVDIMLCFPSFFLILTVVAVLPASLYNIMIVIGLTSWMGTTRFVRAEFLSLREQDFVQAARALGVGSFRIIFRHMMPNAIAPVLVSATIGIATAILTEAGLSFLGFGVPPPHATWGNILSDGKRFIFDAPWLTFIPGVAILVVVLSFNLFGEGLRDVMNPRLRERN